MSNRRWNKQTRKGFLSGGQVKLDVDKDGKITSKDFKMLKSKKKKEKKPTMMAMAIKDKK